MEETQTKRTRRKKTDATEQVEQAEQAENTVAPVVDRADDEEVTDATEQAEQAETKPKTPRGRRKAGKAYRVNTALLNVRESPNLGAELAAEPVRMNELLEIAEVSDGWGKLVNGGYVMMKYVNEVE